MRLTHQIDAPLGGLREERRVDDHHVKQLVLLLETPHVLEEIGGDQRSAGGLQTVEFAGARGDLQECVAAIHLDHPRRAAHQRRYPQAARVGEGVEHRLAPRLPQEPPPEPTGVQVEACVLVQPEIQRVPGTTLADTIRQCFDLSEQHPTLALLGVAGSTDLPQGRGDPRKALTDESEGGAGVVFVAAALAVVVKDEGAAEKLDGERGKTLQEAVEEAKGSVIVGSREQRGARAEGGAEGSEEGHGHWRKKATRPTTRTAATTARRMAREGERPRAPALTEIMVSEEGERWGGGCAGEGEEGSWTRG